MSNELMNIAKQLAALRKRVARAETMEFGTAASLRAAGFALTSEIPIGTQYSSSTKTVGLSKTSTNTSYAVYLEQNVELMRTIKLDAVLWDIIGAGDYTLTIRDYESNVLQTISLTGVPAASLDVVFSANNTIYQPGLYRFRLTRSATAQWYLWNTGINSYFSELRIIDAMSYGGIALAKSVPIKFRFYEQIL